jgi:SUMO ligase MMS21 Smc5/6 complex component
MLLPDSIHPKYSVYYIGSLLLKTLQQKGAMSVADLYVTLKNDSDISFKLYLLSLDWLYLINAAQINNKGDIVLCS